MPSNINYQQFNGQDARRESTFKLIPGQQTSDSSDRHWASGPLITLSVFQMACGIIIIILQFLLNGQIMKYVDDNDGKMFWMSYGIVCGAIMLLVGIFSTCTSSLRSRCLSVFTTILYLFGYVASIVCCAVSVKLYGDIDGNFAIKGISAVNKTIGDPLNVADFVGTVKIEILAMAALAGINFIISITTSALICRGCCTCCHSRTSSPLYMVRTDFSSPAVEIQGL